MRVSARTCNRHFANKENQPCVLLAQQQRARVAEIDRDVDMPPDSKHACVWRRNQEPVELVRQLG